MMVEKEDEKNQEKPVETPPPSNGKVVTYTDKETRPDITPEPSNGKFITEEKEKD